MLINLNNQNQDTQKTQDALQAEITKLGTLASAPPALHGTIHAMLKVLHSAKEEAGQAPPASGTPPNANGSLIDNMGAMMAILSQVEGLIAQLSQSRGENDANVDTAMLGVASANVKAAQDAYTKLINDEAAQAAESAWIKFWECVVGAVVAVIACVAGQPELAAMVVALTVLSVSGVLSDAVQALAKSLMEDPGVASLANGGQDKMSKEAASVIASVMVTLLVTLVTAALTGGASLLGSVETVVEEVVNNAEIGMTDASTWGANATDITVDATEASNPITRVMNQLRNVMNWLIENNPMNKLPKWVNLTIMATAQAISQTNLVTNAINLGMKEHPCSEKEKEQLEKELSIIVGLIMAFISIAAGAGASQTASVIDESSFIGQKLAQFTSWVKGISYLESGLQAGLAAAGVGQGLTQTSLAITQSYIADAELEVAYSKGISELLNTIMSIVGSDAQTNTQNTNTLISENSQSMASMQQSLDQELTKIAQVLAQAG